MAAPRCFATWLQGLGEREKERVEKEINKELADPGARHQMVLSKLDGLIQRRRVVALDPLCCSSRLQSDELLQYKVLRQVLAIIDLVISSRFCT